MTPYITEVTPLTIAGWTIRFKIPNISRIADIPAFEYTPIFEEENRNQLSNKPYKLREHFKKSDSIKHGEFYMIYDVDRIHEEFDFLYGISIVDPNDKENIPPDAASVEISGLYAIFQSPLIEEDGDMEQVIKDLWNHIMTEWLPESEFEYDRSRRDFEHYDKRSHRQFFGGKKQMDIYLPIRQSEKAFREAEKKGRVF